MSTRKLLTVLLLVALGPGQAYALNLCVRADSATGEPRDGAAIRLRSECRESEVSFGTAQDLAMIRMIRENRADIDTNSEAIAEAYLSGEPARVASAPPATTADITNPVASSSCGLTVTAGRAVFNACNVHVQSGEGATWGTGTVSEGTVNGLGNLILGYDEQASSFGAAGPDLPKNGSHNLIVGPGHSYQSYGGFLAGLASYASGVYSSVLGGYQNVATGEFSSVLGGASNTASGDYSSVSGGYENIANGNISSTTGGRRNIARGKVSSVSGGRLNEADGYLSSISGGNENTANGEYASVSGGELNVAAGDASSVSGGSQNRAGKAAECLYDPPDEYCGEFSSVSGGSGNTASGHRSIVSGGVLNIADGDASSISGGSSGTAGGDTSSILGGSANEASGVWASVLGGFDNTASGISSIKP